MFFRSSAYQIFVKTIDSLLSEQNKLKLASDCQELNSKIQQISKLNSLLKFEKLTSQEYVDFISKSKSLKILDCAKINQKSFSDSENLVKAVTPIIEVNLQIFLTSFCEIRNQKKEKFDLLLTDMSFRYKNVSDFNKFKDSLAISKFEICDPNKQIDNLFEQTMLSVTLISQINNLLSQFQNRERSKSIQYFVNCKSGKKILVKSGNPPKCPTNFSEIKVFLKKI